jgi:hypothetical protein
VQPDAKGKAKQEVPDFNGRDTGTVVLLLGGKKGLIGSGARVITQ